MNRNNYESEFNSLFAENVWVVWIEFALSHGVGPLTLALIHLVADEADWKRCWLFSFRWIWVWQTCMPHFVCISARSKHTHRLAVLLSASLSASVLPAGSHTSSSQSCLHYNKHCSLLSVFAHTILFAQTLALFFIFISPFCICKQKPAVICEKCWI